MAAGDLRRAALATRLAKLRNGGEPFPGTPDAGRSGSHDGGPDRLRTEQRSGGCAQFFTIMLFSTDFTPRTSWASFVTSDFSASELATPVMRTTPSVVVTLVLRALVDL